MTIKMFDEFVDFVTICWATLYPKSNVANLFSVVVFLTRCGFFPQEFGDSARARKLYEQDSDSDDEEELEPNPKLEQGKQPLKPFLEQTICKKCKKAVIRRH